MKGKMRRLLLSACFTTYFLFSVFAEESRYSFKPSDKDPFAPLISKNGTILISRKVSLGGLVIKGIIYSEESSVAIINDLVLKKGESIGEYTVLEIEEKKVILKNADKKFILNLEEEEE